MVERVSSKPWSRFKESDYTLEQWHRACLIHLHDEKPTAKAQCKLPVREPNGILNRNGVHAAAAALVNAHGGVKVLMDQKRKADQMLVRLYRQALKEEQPESIFMKAPNAPGESVPQDVVERLNADFSCFLNSGSLLDPPRDVHQSR